MRIRDENEFLKSRIKLRYYKCLVHLPQPRDVSPPKMQEHNFIYRHTWAQVR